MPRRYGAGTVYQRPDGSWEAQWSDGRDATGRRLRGSSAGHPTEAAAWKAMAAARGKSSSSTPRRGGERVDAYLRRWLDAVARPKNRERTYWGYVSIVDNHLIPAFGDRPLRSLTRHEIQAWVDAHPRSPMTVRHHVDVLRSALGKAVTWGLIDKNPAAQLDLPTVKRQSVAGIDEDRARAWLAAVEGLWFERMVTVSLYTGLRQGELLGLRWEDVDFRADAIHVRNALARLPGRGKAMRYVLDEPKSESSRRVVPMLEPVTTALRAEQKRQMSGPGTWKGLVFAHADGPMEGTGLTHHFQAAIKAAGLGPVRWHDLRHGFASLMIAADVDLATLSKIMGHSTYAITVDTYGHLTLGTKREAMAKMGRRMAG